MKIQFLNRRLILNLKYLLMLIFLFSISNFVNAQQNKIIQIVENDNQLNENKVERNHKSSKFSKRSSKSESEDSAREDFNDLQFKSQHSVYVADKKIFNRTGGNKAARLRLEDVSSIEFLYTQNADFNQVKVISIKINNLLDLNQKLDMSKLSAFDQLKYIFLQCGFDCTEDQIQKFILNYKSNITIYYMVSNES